MLCLLENLDAPAVADTDAGRASDLSGHRAGPRALAVASRWPFSQKPLGLNDGLQLFLGGVEGQQCVRESCESTQRAAHEGVNLCFEKWPVHRVPTSAGSELGEVELSDLPAGLSRRKLKGGLERLVVGFLALLLRTPLLLPLLPCARPRVVDVLPPGALERCTWAFAQFLPRCQGDVLPAGERALLVAVAAAQDNRGVQTPVHQRPGGDPQMATVAVIAGGAVP